MNEIYEKVHEGTDAFLASDLERDAKDLNAKSELVYGEVVFEHFIPAIEYTKP